MEFYANFRWVKRFESVILCKLEFASVILRILTFIARPFLAVICEKMVNESLASC